MTENRPLTRRNRRMFLPSLVAALSVVLTLSVTVGSPPPAAAAAAELTPPSIMVALGDSISQASSANGTGRDNLRNSWSTGSASAVLSHRDRLAKSTGTAPATYNVARGGSETSDLPRQAALAVSHSADYVTILSGANNVCHAETVDELPSPDAVRADLAATLATLNAGLPDAKIFVASIPNLTHMYLAARDSAQARLTWAVTGFCPVLLSDPLDRSPAAVARRASVETRVNALNIVIRAACAAAERCWHDGDAVHDVPIALGDISTRDYFHPSIEGQAKIAAATWDKVIEKGVLESGHTVTTFDDVSPRIAWSGTWATTSSTRDFGGSVRYPKTLGAGYYLRFTGTKVLIEARTTPSSGISEVRIDGKLVGKIDGYSPMTRYRQIVFESGALPSGAHTLIVSATPEKFPESSGRNAILDAIIVEDAGW